MTTVVNAIKELGYVEKIFWNTGAYGNAFLHRSSSHPRLTGIKRQAPWALGTRLFAT